MKIKNRQELIKFVNDGGRVEYVFFWGHRKPKNGISKSCFSQWFDSPFENEGNHFLTAEHYMMYRKARLFNDISAAQKLLSVKNPEEAKAIGRSVNGFDQHDWESHRYEIVVTANMAKFNSDPALKEFLLNTANRVIVEASPVDKIWGIGLAVDNSDCENPNFWKGENLLGFALMEVRDQLL